MDDDILYQARLHWVIFVRPTILFLCLLFVWFKFPLFQKGTAIMMGITMIWVGMLWMMYRFSSLTIKKKHVILRTGYINREFVDIPLNKIESVDIRQTLLGSLLQYGSIVITGTGGTRQGMTLICQPLTCRRYIEQQMHA